MSDAIEEEFIPEDEIEAGPAALKKLREKLAVAIKEKQEYMEGWQLSRAEFANYKKQEALFETQKEERMKAEFAESILPALDAFAMAFRDPSFEKADAGWKQGIESVHRELIKALEKMGISAFSPLGEAFDPNKHEAVREIPVDSSEKDQTVASVERSGYTLGDRIIRPAQVSIGVFKQ